MNEARHSQGSWRKSRKPRHDAKAARMGSSSGKVGRTSSRFKSVWRYSVSQAQSETG